MNKNDYVELAIKIFGVYLVVLAVIEAPAIVGSIYGVWSMGDLASTNDDLGNLRRTMTKAQFTILFASSLKLVLYSLIGVYFLRSGAWFFRLVRFRDQ